MATLDEELVVLRLFLEAGYSQLRISTQHGYELTRRTRRMRNTAMRTAGNGDQASTARQELFWDHWTRQHDQNEHIHQVRLGKERTHRKKPFLGRPRLQLHKHNISEAQSFLRSV